MSVINNQFLTPAELGNRWRQHAETIRRKLRGREIASVLIGRRRLIPASEVLRVEAGGEIPAKEPMANTNINRE